MSIEAAAFGTLSRDGELKVSAKGKSYLRLNLAVGEGEAVTWLSVLAFDPEAIGRADKFVRGARIYVEGKLSLSEWTGQDGVKRAGLSIMSWHCRPAAIGRNKPAKREREDNPNGTRQAAQSTQPGGGPAFSDEIPFAPERR